MDKMNKKPLFNIYGERLMTIRELKRFKKEMANIGVKVKRDLKQNFLKGVTQASFNNETGTIYLKTKPTMYQALHERFHAEQWNKLGKVAYNKQTKLEKEIYVFKQLMKISSILTEKKLTMQQLILNLLEMATGHKQIMKQNCTF